METQKIVILSIIGIVVLASIVFFIITNRKDRKTLNPDAEDIVDEARSDHDRRQESN